ncbi:TlpA disulfide reductase family protein [Flavobacterium sp. H122]|uniref:TlpA family protein disulfide reductase n=1 Tax=Flavobacterium sp. H122 TaxID=2529860 RepID=UPI0010A9E4F4|nr:TlpA disulfide reductase family protein [Flavobacterium sp. H122]
MIKFYYILLLLTVPFYSNTINLKGIFSNCTENQFYINGSSFSKKIEIDKNGCFNIKFELPYEGSYHINIKNNYTQVYLNKKTDLVIKADLSKFNESILFEGIGAEENSYWHQKKKIMHDFFDYKSFLTENRHDSISNKKNNSLQNELTILLNSKKGLDSSFVRLENKNIHFSGLSFQRISKVYTSIKTSNFIDLEKIQVTDSILNSESEEDFLFSTNYKSLLNNALKAKIKQINTEQDRYTGKYYLVIFDNIKSVYIKDYMLEQAMTDINSDNPEIDNVFKKIINSTSNQFIINKATKLYQKNKITKIGNSIAPFKFKDINEKTLSSDDLKGKYSFVTIWTSWCSNCLSEIENSNKLSEQYKNIQFVNISIDALAEKNDWKRVIQTRKYKGIHLFADKQDKSDFVKDFVHDKVQKYVLISPEGNLILTDAPPPSDPKLVAKFKELGI